MAANFWSAWLVLSWFFIKDTRWELRCLVVSLSRLLWSTWRKVVACCDTLLCAVGTFPCWVWRKVASLSTHFMKNVWSLLFHSYPYDIRCHVPAFVFYTRGLLMVTGCHTGHLMSNRLCDVTSQCFGIFMMSVWYQLFKVDISRPCLVKSIKVNDIL